MFKVMSQFGATWPKLSSHPTKALDDQISHFQDRKSDDKGDRSNQLTNIFEHELKKFAPRACGEVYNHCEKPFSAHPALS